MPLSSRARTQRHRSRLTGATRYFGEWIFGAPHVGVNFRAPRELLTRAVTELFEPALSDRLCEEVSLTIRDGSLVLADRSPPRRQLSESVGEFPLGLFRVAGLQALRTMLRPIIAATFAGTRFRSQ